MIFKKFSFTGLLILCLMTEPEISESSVLNDDKGEQHGSGTAEA